MSSIRPFGVFITLSSAVLAWAQAVEYEGTWQVSFKNLRGGDIVGVVLVKGSGGTWEAGNSNRNDPCPGRAAPIEIKSSSENELVFEVQRSKVLTGCPDALFTMKRVDGQTLEGLFPDGRKLTLTKK